MKPSQQLKQLYDRIPTFVCEPGCNDCCGPVAMSKTERKKIGLDSSITPVDSTMTCKFYTHSCCSIYKDRPLLCRLFGTTEKLKCPKRGPEKLLTQEQEDEIMKAYLKI